VLANSPNVLIDEIYIPPGAEFLYQVTGIDIPIRSSILIQDSPAMIPAA